MRVLFVDPGKMTGWFVIDTTTGQWDGGELWHEDFLRWVDPKPLGDSPLIYWGIERVVAEHFDITAKTVQAIDRTQPLWSVEQTGCLRYWCRIREIPFETQSRTAMHFDKDGSKLKKLDWWNAKPGVTGEKGHRRAAAKHALKWLVDKRLIKPEVLL